MTKNPYAPPRAFVQIVIADRSTRLGATLLDGIIFAGMVYVPLLVGILLRGAATRATGDQGASAIFAASGLLTLTGLIVWCWLTIRFVNRNGQSIAKKLVGIKVVRADGSPVSLGRVFWLRNFVNGLISIIPLYGFVDVLCIFGESRRCLHDKIADTVVVKA